MKYSRPFLTLLALVPGLSTTPLLAQSTVRVSVGPGGVEGDGRSDDVVLSGDGQVVVFSSLASNLVTGDGNNTWDVFAYDRASGQVELVSRTPAGLAAPGGSQEPTVSEDGRWVLFRSNSPDLVPGGSGGMFLLDRQQDAMSLIRHPVTGSGFYGENFRISPDGRYVVFDYAATLTPEDTNSLRDIYRWDRVTDTFDLVSTDAQGTQNNKSLTRPSVSIGGRYVAFFGPTDTWAGISGVTGHVWRKDMQTGELLLASSLQDGTPASGLCRSPLLSGDGQSAVFETVAGNIPGYPGGAQHIAIKDFLSGECKVVSVNNSNQPSNNYCWEPGISGDGRFVNFRTTGSNMPGPAGHYSIYVRDREANTTLLASVSTGLQPGDASSLSSAVSITGGFVAFMSDADNLVPNDTAGHGDIFLRDVHGLATHGYGRVLEQSVGCLPSLSWAGSPSLSAGSGFTIELSDVRTLQPGILIYSRKGPSALPFFGERLYVAPPIVRTAAQQAGGSTSGPCNGSFSFDFNVYLASGLDGALVPGSQVWAQYWSRDPGGSQSAWLSDAMTFVVAP